MRPSSPPTLLSSSPWVSDENLSATIGNASGSTLMTLSSSFCKDDDLLPLVMSNMDEIHQLETLAVVGEGPMRFGPVSRSTSIQEDLMKCNASAMDNYMKVKLACENEGLVHRFSEEQIFRVASYKKFSITKTLRLLKKIDTRLMNTTVRQLEDQLRTQTLFPLPCVRSENIDSFFYMRPARYDPNETSTSTIIANLIYVMDSLYERHRDYENHKIGFIANMNDWTMRHFSVDYCFQFMQALQGRTAPVNVDLFLIVNPPAWFNKIWKIMKPMLAPAFRKKVHMISEHKLGDFLEAGFGKYLPDEFESGQADVPALVEDFISFRKHVERSSLDRCVNAMNTSLPIWCPTKNKDNTKASRRAQKRRSVSRVPLSMSHTERNSIETNSSVVSDELRDLPAFSNSTKSSGSIPISSWSRMTNPWDDVAADDGYGDEEGARVDEFSGDDSFR